MKKEILTTKAPSPIGAYSQAIAAGDTLFISGQIALDEMTGELLDGDAAEQTKKVMEHIGNILGAWDLGYEDLVKTTIFVASIEDFPKINQVYEQYLIKPYPARSTVEVSQLPKGALVEIESIAVKKKD